MYQQQKVNIPISDGGITVKVIKGTGYVYYTTGHVYSPKEKRSNPVRVTIGKQCEDDPTKMLPNEKEILKLQAKYNDLDLNQYAEYGYTQTEILRLKEAFDLFDTEEKGVLDIDELQKNLNGLGIMSKNKDLKNLAAEGKNQIDFNTFVEIFGAKPVCRSEEEAKKLFSVFLGDYDFNRKINNEKPMKLSNTVLLAAVFLVSALFFSCGSTSTLDSSSVSQSPEPSKKSSMGSSGGISGGSEVSVGSIKTTGLDKLPKRLAEAPKFDFTGNKLQIELENMYYDGFELIADKTASGAYALKLTNDSSWAIAEISFPAGSYEGLANVYAPDSSHSRFNLYINSDSYLVYGSEPPIGKYELTTRALASFTLDQPTTVTLKIQKNDLRNPENNGQDGMTVDYVLFRKIN